MRHRMPKLPMYTIITGKRATPINPSFAGSAEILCQKYIPNPTVPRTKTTRWYKNIFNFVMFKKYSGILKNTRMVVRTCE